MKATVSRLAARDAIKAVTAAVDTRNIKPILKDILLSCDGASLTAAATDLEVTVVRTIVCEGESGAIVIPGDVLLSILTQSADETLKLEVKDMTLHVDGAGSHFEIVGVSADEFPVLPNAPKKCNATMSIKDLRLAIAQTAFAVSAEKQRYALSGLLFEATDKMLNIVATDGHRLAWVRINGEFKPCSGIISLKAIQQVAKLDGEGQVRVCIEERKATFDAGSALIVAQLVEGSFPEFREVIPENPDKSFTVDPAELYQRIKEAAIFSARDTRQVTLDFTAAGVVIEGQNAEVGNSRVECAGKYTGDPLTVQFNPDFLLDGLNVFKEQVDIKFIADDRPAVIETEDYTYLCMPIVKD